MQKRRILIIDNNDELRAILARVLGELGTKLLTTGDRDEALRRRDIDHFRFDHQRSGRRLTNKRSACQRTSTQTFIGCREASTTEPTIVKAFKMGAVNCRRHPYAEGELREIVEQTLSYKLRYVDDPSLLSHTHEKIEFELPSDLALMNGVLQYLLARVSKLGLVAAEGSNLYVALDEAFVNAVKHGNKNDATKLVRIGAELSPKEACFTIEDEGEGFDVQDHSRSARPGKSLQVIGPRRAAHLQHHGRS